MNDRNKFTLQNYLSPEESTINVAEKYHPKEVTKNINTLNACNYYLPSR